MFAVKIKVSLCSTNRYAMKTYVEVKIQLHAFLTSALDEDDWSDSHPDRYIPWERAPVPTRVGPRVVLDSVVK
jgi:hypothetical protein